MESQGSLKMEEGGRRVSVRARQEEDSLTGHCSSEDRRGYRPRQVPLESEKGPKRIRPQSLQKECSPANTLILTCL